MSTDAEPEDFFGDLMDDPEGYYPPTPPNTCQTFTMKSGKSIKLHIIGWSHGEAHNLWNGAKVVTDYLEDDPSRVEDKTVLELGAAAGLPSLACGILGARKVVVTDYPDEEILEVIQKNVSECDGTVEPAGKIAGAVDVVGFRWGTDSAPLLERLSPFQSAQDPTPKFDVLILADLLFRHVEHDNLVKTVKETLRPGPESVAYVFFTSYRPWKKERDEQFFDLARKAGLDVEQVVQRMLDKPLFENDPGDLDVQKTVKGFELRWPKSPLEVSPGGGS